MRSKHYLTIKQAAKIIGVTELTLRNWDNSKKFEATRHPINNYRVYTLDQIDELMKKLGRKKSSRKLVIKVLED
ncbi:MAG: MerR family transcriptional regulator [Patescibacteria group bacterium]